ncbi:transcription elongation factor GreA [Nocardiopsis terrae]|uniref:Transcription elongation factor GreA n=1 Tax=Nocardiopsis terrae TaxID=372655 RepID=A0ABR9HAM0_9ACTN|nr:GreA/GreB family elongation factor [Nocardiopsis terrae]MBE1456079.1 transcription elongation factor GreA [Nocardiopsis terrae]GHC95988.1 transcription elongation factor GreA [Nocardiopsis terrae]
MAENNRTWLTPGTYERLTAELAVLTGAAGPEEHGFAGIEDRDAREARVNRIQDLLKDAVVGEAPPDDGIAEPGMVVTVRYGDDPEPETFLLGVRDRADADGIPVCSPDSPLGRALIGAAQGEERTYTAPSGRTLGVSLVRAVPYGPESAQVP